MLEFPCQVCNTRLSATEAQAGSLVRCPTCLTTLKVPTAQPAPAFSNWAPLHKNRAGAAYARQQPFVTSAAAGEFLDLESSSTHRKEVIQCLIVSSVVRIP